MGEERFFFNGADVAEAERNGISYNTFHNRIMQLGWTIDKAKTYPVRLIDPADVAEAEANGIGFQTFYTRVRRSKWDVERAKTEPIHHRKAAKQ